MVFLSRRVYFVVFYQEYAMEVVCEYVCVCVYLGGLYSFMAVYMAFDYSKDALVVGSLSNFVCYWWGCIFQTM